MKAARRALAFLVAVISISPAYANDHFARVNEVLLSYGGDATKQLVEIEDTANEAFSGGGYTLFVYGADGTSQEHSQNIVLSPGTMRVTLATASAFTQFGLVIKTSPPDIVLNLSGELPANGTACFRKSGVDLHCLAWGTATMPSQMAANGRVAGPAPTDGLSIQRQPSNCAGIGAPTANAMNATLPCMDPPMGGDSPGGDAGTNPPPEDDGCSASAGGTWFGFVATASLFGYARARRARRREDVLADV